VSKTAQSLLDIKSSVEYVFIPSLENVLDELFGVRPPAFRFKVKQFLVIVLK